MSNVQDMDEALREDDCEDEGWYEPEDCENCTDSGIEQEWEWDCEQGAYRCLSCGNIQ